MLQWEKKSYIFWGVPKERHKGCDWKERNASPRIALTSLAWPQNLQLQQMHCLFSVCFLDICYFYMVPYLLCFRNSKSPNAIHALYKHKKRIFDPNTTQCFLFSKELKERFWGLKLPKRLCQIKLSCSYSRKAEHQGSRRYVKQFKIKKKTWTESSLSALLLQDAVKEDKFIYFHHG